MDPNMVLSSPALSLLLELEDAALAAGAVLSIQNVDDGRLRIGPASILTSDRCARIRTYRDHLRLLVQLTDDDVQRRTAAFRAHLREEPSTALCDLRLPAARRAAGGCRACGEMSEPQWWCWRCQMAATRARDWDLPVSWTPVPTAPRASLEMGGCAGHGA
jgi:hypothetical protein